MPDAPGADRILVVADDPRSGPVLVDVAPGGGVEVGATPVVDGRPGPSARSSPTAPGRPGPVLAVRRRPPPDLLVRAAVAVALDSIGLAGAALDATVGYAAVRHQFGRPIGSFQAVKHACANVAVELTVSRRLVADAVERLVAGAPGADVAASMAKAHAAETGVAATGTALQLHGGIGYTWEHGLHVLLKRAALDRSLFGSPAAHRARLARRLRTPRGEVSGARRATGGEGGPAVADDPAIAARSPRPGPTGPRPLGQQLLLLAVGAEASCGSPRQRRRSAGHLMSQRQDRRQRPALEQVLAQPAGQRAGVAQQPVEHDHAPDVEVQVVLGREPDAGQHLLAVAGHRACAASRRWPWPWPR